MLGDRTTSGGKTTGAKAAKMTYFLKNQLVYVRAEGRKVDTSGTAWEEEFAKYFDNTTFKGLLRLLWLGLSVYMGLSVYPSSIIASLK